MNEGLEDEMCPNCVTPWKCNGPHILEGDNEVEEEETVNKIGRIEFVEEKTKEDGSSLMTFEIDDAASKLIEEIGLRFLVTCAAYDLDLEDAFNAVSDRGEYLQQKPNDNEESSRIGE